MRGTVLITGATGFAGGFLVELYLEAGWQVHGTVHDAPDDLSWFPSGAALHPVDLRQERETAQLVALLQPDVLVHLAAQSSVRESLRSPLATLSTNVAMQVNLLEAVRAHSARSRVVVVGSCDEYGSVEMRENPVDEATPLRPVTPYAVSKVAQDFIGYQYAVAHDMDVIRVRPFIQVGPRRSDQFVAGSFARQVAEIEAGLAPPIVEVGNVDLQRDITDVRDVVRGYTMLAERGERGEVYNLGSGTATTLRQLLLATTQAAGVDAEVRQVSALQRRGESALLVSNSSKFKDLTGWEPAITLEQSAADALAYWREQIAKRARSIS